jgi:hypothetical protein
MYQCYVFVILVFNTMPNTKLSFPSQTSGPFKTQLVLSLQLTTHLQTLLHLKIPVNYVNMDG